MPQVTLRAILTSLMLLAASLARADDCNSNGVDDALDVMGPTSSDCDRDNLPDECEAAPPYCNNDHCDGAWSICPGNTVFGSTTGADADSEATCGQPSDGPAIWYRYDPIADGVLTVDACGSSFDTVLSIYASCPGLPGSEIACDDDSSCGNQALVSTAVYAGSTYWIRMAGKNGGGGSFALTLTGPPCGIPALSDPIQGGRMYDTWWKATGSGIPPGTYPRYPPAGQQSGSTTFRCAECHGWDYKGAAGAYGAGPHYTGIRGVDDSTMPFMDMYTIIRWAFDRVGLRGDDTWHLVAFLKLRMIDTNDYIDAQGRFIGDAAIGEPFFHDADRGCARCHGDAGDTINLGPADQPVYLRDMALQEPPRVLHHIRFGHPGVPEMPGWLTYGATDQDAADIGRYCQTSLQPDCPHDGDMDEDGQLTGSDIAMFTESLIAATPTPEELCRADLDETGQVDEADLAMFLALLLSP